MKRQKNSPTESGSKKPKLTTLTDIEKIDEPADTLSVTDESHSEAPNLNQSLSSIVYDVNAKKITAPKSIQRDLTVLNNQSQNSLNSYSEELRFLEDRQQEDYLGQNIFM